MFRYRRLTGTPVIGGGNVTGGDMNFGRGAADFIADAPNAVAQAILTRLNLWQGEWFLDLAAGTPWMQQVLGKPRGPGIPDAAIRARIAQTPFVTRILDYASYYNSTNRSLTIGCKVDTAFGATSLVTTIPVPTMPAPLPPPT